MADFAGMSDRKKRKFTYWAKLEKALFEFKNILVISVDFVGSKQMQEVRLAIRGRGLVVMGKNTIMRKVIRDNVAKNPKLEALLPHISGNMGFIFTNGDLNALRKEVTKFTMPAAAKAGVIAPIDVTVPPGPTGMDPGQTAFFQTLNVATKIVKGCIEITAAVQLCFAGEKVTASAVALLSKLGIKPFEYGILVSTVYEDGDVYDAAVLDLDQDDLIMMFCNSVSKLAAISFELDMINEVTVPHSFGHAFRLIAAACITTEYEFEELKAVKEALANPGAGSGAAAGDAPAAAAVEEEDDEEEAAPAMDMFGGDDEEEAGDY